MEFQTCNLDTFPLNNLNECSYVFCNIFSDGKDTKLSLRDEIIYTLSALHKSIENSLFYRDSIQALIKSIIF
jgi:hypothetical protein